MMSTYFKSAVCMVFTVTAALLQQQTFERSRFKDGTVIRSIQERSLYTCVELCLQLRECRYLRFIKLSKECQLYSYVLLYYGNESSDEDVVDIKKVTLLISKTHLWKDLNDILRCYQAYAPDCTTQSLYYYACGYFNTFLQILVITGISRKFNVLLMLVIVRFLR